MSRAFLAAATLLASLGLAQADTLPSIFVVPGKACPPDSRVLTYDEAVVGSRDVCRVLGTWYIARLAEGGSMDGPGYRCGIRRSDTRDLGHILCRREAPMMSVSLPYGAFPTDVELIPENNGEVGVRLRKVAL